MRKIKGGESGRSILEMIGVLAVLILLTIGGQKVFRTIQNKSVATEVTKAVTTEVLIRQDDLRGRSSKGENKYTRKGIGGLDVIVQNATAKAREGEFWVTIGTEIEPVRTSLCRQLVEQSEQLKALKTLNFQYMASNGRKLVSPDLCEEDGPVQYFFLREGMTLAEGVENLNCHLSGCPSKNVCPAHGSCSCSGESLSITCEAGYVKRGCDTCSEGCVLCEGNTIRTSDSTSCSDSCTACGEGEKPNASHTKCVCARVGESCTTDDNKSGVINAACICVENANKICTKDEDCSYPTGRCNKAKGLCECNESAGWYGTWPVCQSCGEHASYRGGMCRCDEAAGYYGSFSLGEGECTPCHQPSQWNGTACVECLSNDDCASRLNYPYPYCEDQHICVTCLTDADCEGDQTCNTTEERHACVCEHNAGDPCTKEGKEGVYNNNCECELTTCGDCGETGTCEENVCVCDTSRGYHGTWPNCVKCEGEHSKWSGTACVCQTGYYKYPTCGTCPANSTYNETTQKCECQQTNGYYGSFEPGAGGSCQQCVAPKTKWNASANNGSGQCECAYGTNGTICCNDNGLAWNEGNQDYTDTNILVCGGCPIANVGDTTSQGTVSEQDSSVCCLNHYGWSTENKSYSAYNLAACGCPGNGVLTGTSCCDDGFEWNNGSYSKVNVGVCGCPRATSSVTEAWAGGGVRQVGNSCCWQGYLVNAEGDYLTTQTAVPCVECVGDSDCADKTGKPLCEATGHTCVECKTDNDCQNNTNGNTCNLTTHTCASCGANADYDADKRQCVCKTAFNWYGADFDLGTESTCKTCGEHASYDSTKGKCVCNTTEGYSGADFALGTTNTCTKSICSGVENNTPCDDCPDATACWSQTEQTCVECSTCQSNADCQSLGTGFYCKAGLTVDGNGNVVYGKSSSHPDGVASALNLDAADIPVTNCYPSPGVCSRIGDYEDIGISTDSINVTFRVASSTVGHGSELHPNRNWWSAQNWCEAQGLTLPPIALFQCYTHHINNPENPLTRVMDKTALQGQCRSSDDAPLNDVLTSIVQVLPNFRVWTSSNYDDKSPNTCYKYAITDTHINGVEVSDVTSLEVFMTFFAPVYCLKCGENQFASSTGCKQCSLSAAYESTEEACKSCGDKREWIDGKCVEACSGTQYRGTDLKCYACASQTESSYDFCSACSETDYPRFLSANDNKCRLCSTANAYEASQQSCDLCGDKRVMIGNMCVKACSGTQYRGTDLKCYDCSTQTESSYDFCSACSETDYPRFLSANDNKCRLCSIASAYEASQQSCDLCGDKRVMIGNMCVKACTTGSSFNDNEFKCRGCATATTYTSTKSECESCTTAPRVWTETIPATDNTPAYGTCEKSLCGAHASYDNTKGKCVCDNADGYYGDDFPVGGTNGCRPIICDSIISGLPVSDDVKATMYVSDKDTIVADSDIVLTSGEDMYLYGCNLVVNGGVILKNSSSINGKGNLTITGARRDEEAFAGAGCTRSPSLYLKNSSIMMKNVFVRDESSGEICMYSDSVDYTTDAHIFADGETLGNGDVTATRVTIVKGVSGPSGTGIQAGNVDIKYDLFMSGLSNIDAKSNLKARSVDLYNGAFVDADVVHMTGSGYGKIAVRLYGGSVTARELIVDRYGIEMVKIGTRSSNLRVDTISADTSNILIKNNGGNKEDANIYLNSETDLTIPLHILSETETNNLLIKYEGTSGQGKICIESDSQDDSLYINDQHMTCSSCEKDTYVCCPYGEYDATTNSCTCTATQDCPTGKVCESGICSSPNTCAGQYEAIKDDLSSSAKCSVSGSTLTCETFVLEEDTTKEVNLSLCDIKVTNTFSLKKVTLKANSLYLDGANLGKSGDNPVEDSEIDISSKLTIKKSGTSKGSIPKLALWNSYLNVAGETEVEVNNIETGYVENAMIILQDNSTFNTPQLKAMNQDNDVKDYLVLEVSSGSKAIIPIIEGVVDVTLNSAELQSRSIHIGQGLSLANNSKARVYGDVVFDNEWSENKMSNSGFKCYDSNVWIQGKLDLRSSYNQLRCDITIGKDFKPQVAYIYGAKLTVGGDIISQDPTDAPQGGYNGDYWTYQINSQSGGQYVTGVYVGESAVVKVKGKVETYGGLQVQRNTTSKAQGNLDVCRDVTVSKNPDTSHYPTGNGSINVSGILKSGGTVKAYRVQAVTGTPAGRIEAASVDATNKSGDIVVGGSYTCSVDTSCPDDMVLVDGQCYFTSHLIDGMTTHLIDGMTTTEYCSKWNVPEERCVQYDTTDQCSESQRAYCASWDTYSDGNPVVMCNAVSCCGNDQHIYKNTFVSGFEFSCGACPSNTPYYDAELQRCLECGTDSDCTSGKLCVNHYCLSTSCTNGTQYCSSGTNTCSSHQYCCTKEKSETGEPRRYAAHYSDPTSSDEGHWIVNNVGEGGYCCATNETQYCYLRNANGVCETYHCCENNGYHFIGADNSNKYHTYGACADSTMNFYCQTRNLDGTCRNYSICEEGRNFKEATTEEPQAEGVCCGKGSSYYCGRKDANGKCTQYNCCMSTTTTTNGVTTQWGQYAEANAGGTGICCSTGSVGPTPYCKTWSGDVCIEYGCN